MMIDSGTLLGALGTVIMLVMGWLLNRSVKSLDKNIDDIAYKVDALSAKVDTLYDRNANTRANLAGLNARVSQLETLFGNRSSGGSGSEGDSDEH